MPLSVAGDVAKQRSGGLAGVVWRDEFPMVRAIPDSRFIFPCCFSPHPPIFEFRTYTRPAQQLPVCFPPPTPAVSRDSWITPIYRCLHKLVGSVTRVCGEKSTNSEKNPLVR